MQISDRTMSGTIFNIQKFSIHDGPGIRTVVFFKGCPLRCKWCSNPESQLNKPQILWNPKNCLHCLHCKSVCSTGAISFKQKTIYINPSLCKGCLNCIQGCPQKALKLEGMQKTVQEVLDIVLQDSVFYEESNGGITLSGGEFLSQPDFANNLLLASKEEGLNTCCETTGFADPTVFSKIIQNIDNILFDIKHWDDKKHIQGTGVSNELPLFNMHQAIESKKKLLPRIPVIPGFNDSLEDAKQFSSLLIQNGITTCQLLPFHQFGENKYQLLNQSYAYSNQPALHKEDLSDYIQIFHKCGVHAFF